MVKKLLTHDIRPVFQREIEMTWRNATAVTRLWSTRFSDLESVDCRHASPLPIMAKRIPLHPKHPERICWGCDRYCPAHSLSCGNGSSRTQHPVELLGEDWLEHGDWGFDNEEEAARPAQ